MATANQLQNMSAPLLDRLEIIQLSGYTLDEKRHIAQVLQATPYVHSFSIHTAKIPIAYRLSSSKPIKIDMSHPVQSDDVHQQKNKLCVFLFERSLKIVADLQRHLIPGLLGEHGLSSDQLHFPAEAILLIADGYTREVGFATACLSCFQHDDCMAFDPGFSKCDLHLIELCKAGLRVSRLLLMSCDPCITTAAQHKGRYVLSYAV